MAEKETPAAAVAQVPKKGKGKGPPKGPPPAKGSGKGNEAASPLPSWQKPEISAEWQPERMVNWQPIRQTSRIQGSVWQQVHDSLEGGAAQLPEDLLGRFMRKASEARPKKTSEQKKSAKRLLPSKQGLVADIHHALLTRKGVRIVQDLKWIIGPGSDDEASQDEHGDALSEELLEALLGLLGAAVGEERSLTAAGETLKDGVQSEIFLRQILQSVPLQQLQSRVQLSLDMARFPGKAADCASGLDLALTAAWSIIDSRAVPILLEGILLLGNSVNASSKNLGGAVGVTLDSLTKLAHTRCLPAKQVSSKGKKAASRTESALEVLTLHLDEANEGFIHNLASDLDACHAAKDFDRALMDGLVQELATQMKQVKRNLQNAGPDEAAATSPARLRGFLDSAEPQLTQLQDLLEEVDEATESLRQWFAEPPGSSLHDMLKALAALREMLPAASPSERTRVSEHSYQQSETRKRRLEEKKAQKALQKEAAILNIREREDLVSEAPFPADVVVPIPADVVATEVESNATVSEPGEPAESREAPDADGAKENVAAVLETSPSSVLAQILSFRQGTVWISWVSDWETLGRSNAMEGKVKAFEILQFNVSDISVELKPEQALQRWRCMSSPHKLDLPLGCHYTFAVRAVLIPASQLDDDSADAAVSSASAMSSSVTVDLRYYSNCQAAHTVSSPAPSPTAAPTRLAPPGPRLVDEKTPSPRRGRVASSMGDFLQSLQASGGGSPARQPPSFAADVSVKGSPSLHFTSKEAALPAARLSEESPPARFKAVPDEAAVMPNEAGKDVQSGVVPAGHDSEEVEDALSPQSLPSRASGQSWASEAEFSEFDDASLSRLAQALRFLESGTGPQLATSPHRPADELRRKEPDLPGATPNIDGASGMEEISNTVHTEHFDDAHKHTAPGDLKASSGSKVPRAVSIFDEEATLESMAKVLDGRKGAEPPAQQKHQPLPRAASIFDDQDTLDSMAQILSNVHSVDRSEQVGGCLKPGLSGDLLDGNEVLAAAERAFKKLQEKPCRACGGTGYVGLFGATGFGFFQSQCTSCKTSMPTGDP